MKRQDLVSSINLMKSLKEDKREEEEGGQATGHQHHQPGPGDAHIGCWWWWCGGPMGAGAIRGAIFLKRHELSWTVMAI